MVPKPCTQAALLKIIETRSDPLRRDFRHVAMSVRDGDDLQWLRLGAVSNQVRIHGEKPDFSGSQVAALQSPMASLVDLSGSIASS